MQFPEQDDFHDAFKERMRWLMFYQKDVWKFEYEAWQALGSVSP